MVKGNKKPKDVASNHLVLVLLHVDVRVLHLSASEPSKLVSDVPGVFDEEQLDRIEDARRGIGQYSVDYLLISENVYNIVREFHETEELGVGLETALGEV